MAEFGNPSEIEIVLKRGDREAIVSPYGAALRGYFVRRADGNCDEIITRYAGARSAPRPAGDRSIQQSSFQIGKKIGGQGDVLIPFPGRISDGAYQFAGESLQMERNDHEGPNAIHGFLRSVVWNIEDETGDAAKFSVELHATDYKSRGYPFSLRAHVAYRLVSDGLECHFAIQNIGVNSAPVAAGFHPYFTTGSALIDSDDLRVPMMSVLEFDGLLPTGKVLPVDGTPLDFRDARFIGVTRFNNCYLDPIRDADGLARISLASPSTGRTLTVWMDRTFDFVVLYSGDPLPPEHRRRSLAIEPMTCGSDAFNHPEWGLVTLEPGKSLSGSWGVTSV